MKPSIRGPPTSAASTRIAEESIERLLPPRRPLRRRGASGASSERIDAPGRYQSPRHPRRRGQADGSSYRGLPAPAARRSWRKLVRAASERGFAVECFHCPFDPESRTPFHPRARSFHDHFRPAAHLEGNVDMVIDTLSALAAQNGVAWTIGKLKRRRMNTSTSSTWRSLHSNKPGPFTTSSNGFTLPTWTSARIESLYNRCVRRTCPFNGHVTL